MIFVTTQRACRYGCNKALPMSAPRSKLQDEPNITHGCVFLTKRAYEKQISFQCSATNVSASRSAAIQTQNYQRARFFDQATAQSAALDALQRN